MDPTLKEALQHIENLIGYKGCSFAERFYGSRPKGESCSEFKTWQQGVPSQGCLTCEARAFLTRVKDSK
jgi:hypothetical protein